MSGETVERKTKKKMPCELNNKLFNPLFTNEQRRINIFFATKNRTFFLRYKNSMFAEKSLFLLFIYLILDL